MVFAEDNDDRGLEFLCWYKSKKIMDDDEMEEHEHGYMMQNSILCSIVLFWLRLELKDSQCVF